MKLGFVNIFAIQKCVVQLKSAAMPFFSKSGLTGAKMENLGRQLNFTYIFATQKGMVKLKIVCNVFFI